MSYAPTPTVARLAMVLLLAAVVAVPLAVFVSLRRADVAVAAVRAPDAKAPQTSAPDNANALQDPAERAGQIGRTAALSLIGLALAVSAVMLVFRRDFKEAAGVFAVGLIAVLLATPSGLRLLRSTAELIFGGQ
jgi:hypothetical protein